MGEAERSAPPAERLAFAAVTQLLPNGIPGLDSPLGFNGT